MYTYNTHYRQKCDSGKLVKVILRNIFLQIMFETKKRNIAFYLQRQEVAEGRSSKGHASKSSDFQRKKVGERFYFS